jgi:hypothetical protein
VADVRTTPLDPEDEANVVAWAQTVRDCYANLSVDWVQLPRIRNLPRALEAFSAGALDLATELSAVAAAFARAAVLRVGQRALDGREGVTPSRRQLAEQLVLLTQQMVAGLREFATAASRWADPNLAGDRIVVGDFDRKLLLHRSVVGLETDPRVSHLRGKVSCVITSPPYPGVHVLYHRWQYRGRKETAAPYWIANVQDGQSESYYTLGGRSAAGVEKYYNTLTAAFRSIRPLLRDDAVVAQLVAFPKAETDLPRFLRAMQGAGFDEEPSGPEGRIWRAVPNRRWYHRIRADNMSGEGAAAEVLLLHRVRVS